MPKTVEDILKEQGVIKPIPQEEVETEKFEKEGTDLRKIQMSIEKIQAEIQTLKDFKQQTDEVSRELTEKIGEIRSLFFQRETLIKETETKVKVIEDTVSDIGPSKYLRELEKRKEEILEVQAKIEKLELVQRDLVNGLSTLKQTLQNIKSVDNLEMILNEIKDNVSRGRELKSDIERASAKSERFYFEMENRIKDFVVLKDRTDKLDGLTKELTKSVDGVNIRLASFISRSDIEEFKKNINVSMTSNRALIEDKLKEIESFLSLPTEEIANRTNQLKRRRVEVSNLLLNIEEQYKKAFISEKTYSEVKQKNEEILKQIEDELRQLQSGERFSLKTLPSLISKIEDRTIVLDNKFDEQKKYIDGSLKSMISESRLSSVTEVVKIQTDMLDDVVKKIKDVSDKITKLSTNVNSFDLRIRFFEVMDGLIRVDNSNEITYYLTELEKLISAMRDNKLLEPHKESLIVNILTDISSNWRKYGYNDIATVFDNEIEKIKSNKKEIMLKY
jgi:tetrahydromethanopterin S-methyltransferase subunit B